MSQKELGESLGVNASRIRDYELDVCEPNLHMLLQLSRYFKISLDDFITKKLSVDLSTQLNSRNNLQHPARILVVSADESGSENIVHVPAKACAGYLNGYEDPTFVETLPAYRLPGIRNGTYRSFEINGDSMLPLTSGSIVVGKYVESWREIKSNYTYILVTKEDGVVYKRVINKVKSKGQLVLLSDNPVYEPYSINIDDVNEAWVYYCHVTNAGAEQKSNLEQLLQAVEELKLEVASLKN